LTEEVTILTEGRKSIHFRAERPPNPSISTGKLSLLNVARLGEVQRRTRATPGNLMIHETEGGTLTRWRSQCSLSAWVSRIVAPGKHNLFEACASVEVHGLDPRTVPRNHHTCEMPLLEVGKRTRQLLAKDKNSRSHDVKAVHHVLQRKLRRVVRLCLKPSILDLRLNPSPDVVLLFGDPRVTLNCPDTRSRSLLNAICRAVSSLLTISNGDPYVLVRKAGIVVAGSKYLEKDDGSTGGQSHTCSSPLWLRRTNISL
jgi:hypothetical protein